MNPINGKGSKRRPESGNSYGDNWELIYGKTNPVKKNMDKFHKPSTHPDKTKYNRKVTKADILKGPDFS
jgi:hypothetical protein